MLHDHTVEEIAEIEDRLAEIVSQLRKIRREMRANDCPTAKIEIEKAKRYIGYLEGDWLRQQKGRVEARIIELQNERAAERLRKAPKLK